MALIPIIAGSLIGCKGKNTFRDTAKSNQKRVYTDYTTRIREGENLALYLAREGDPMNLNEYIDTVKALNKDNKQAFVNYDGGQIRADRKINLPDLNGDGTAAGRVGEYVGKYSSSR